MLISGQANAAVITHFPRVANISISCSECSDSNKRMHVQYMLQLDLEVNSKQIGDASLSRSLSPSPPLSYLLRFFFATNKHDLIILLICRNLFDLSMKSIMQGIIAFSTRSHSRYIYVLTYLYSENKQSAHSVITFNWCKCSLI